jgi:hypothetical protein
MPRTAMKCIQLHNHENQRPKRANMQQRHQTIRKGRTVQTPWQAETETRSASMNHAYAKRLLRNLYIRAGKVQPKRNRTLKQRRNGNGKRQQVPVQRTFMRRQGTIAHEARHAEHARER